MIESEKKDFILLGCREFSSSMQVALYDLALLSVEGDKKFFRQNVEVAKMEDVKTAVGQVITVILEDRGMSKGVIGWEPTDRTWEVKVSK